MMTLLLPLAQIGIDDPNRFNGFLILAYVAMGLVGLVYVGSLIVRQRNLQKDIELMNALLQDEDETAVS